MRAKVLATALEVTGAGTATSTPILLIAGNVGSFWAGDQSVPGEDMGFPSSGSCVVALSLQDVSLESGGEINVLTSNNYYADDGSGESFSIVASYNPSGGLSSAYQTVFLDRVPLGEAVELQIVSVHTADAGYVTAYLLSN